MITKEQWAEIEKDLAGYFGCKKFQLGEDKISVIRENCGEGQRKLAVYFNDIIKGVWTHKTDDKGYNPLVEKFWRKHSRSMWNAKHRASMIKLYGKKRYHKEFSYLDTKYVFYSPIWPKAKALVTQFKKIKELELVEPESKS